MFKTEKKSWREILVIHPSTKRAKFQLAPMGVLTPLSVNARHLTQPPINNSENSSEHMSGLKKGQRHQGEK